MHPLISSQYVVSLFGCRISVDFLLALGATSWSWIISFLIQHSSFSLTFSLPDLCLGNHIWMLKLTGHTKKAEAGDFLIIEVYTTH